MMLAREEGREAKGVVKKEQSETTSKDKSGKQVFLGRGVGEYKLKILFWPY